MKIILFIFYSVVAFLLALGYWFLAGNPVVDVAGKVTTEGDGLGVVLPLLLPFILFFLVIFYLMGRRIKEFKIIFWIGVVWLSIPIVLNLSSDYLSGFGYERTAYWLHKLRYASLIIVPIALIFIMFFVGQIRDVIVKIKHTFNFM